MVLAFWNRQEYEDAELLMALREEELNRDGNEYAFTDDEIRPSASCTAALAPHLFDNSDPGALRDAKAALSTGLSVPRWFSPD